MAIDEIAPDVYRISLFVPEADLSELTEPSSGHRRTRSSQPICG